MREATNQDGQTRTELQSFVDKLERENSELKYVCNMLHETNSMIQQRQKAGESEISNLKEENKAILQSSRPCDFAIKAAKYREVVKKNKRIEYPWRILEIGDIVPFDGEDTVVAEDIHADIKTIVEITTKMRRGEVIHRVDPIRRPQHPEFYKGFMPYYREFVDALIEYRHTINFMEDKKIRFSIGYLEIPREILNMLEDALQQTHFRKLCFYENLLNGVGYINFIANCVKANNRLKTLVLEHVYFECLEDIEILCAAVHSSKSLKYLEISECGSEEAGLRDVFTKLKSESIVCFELSNSDLSNLQPNDITEFLSSNPSLKNLNMSNGQFNEQDIIHISNALKQNTTLRELDLELDEDHAIDWDILDSAVFDQSSLNGTYDSNHHCEITVHERDMTSIMGNFNTYDDPVLNRRKKLYNILSTRNRHRRNAAYFESDNIGIKHIPQILSLLKPFSEHYLHADNGLRKRGEVKPLSIAFEILRDWNMPQLYYGLNVMDEG